MKKFINKLLTNKATESFLSLLIILNVICLGLETDKNFYTNYSMLLNKIEFVSIIIFSVEYVLRLFTLNKFKYIFKPIMIVDLFAIMPFYLSTGLDLRILRIFRLFRILWIFKLARYFHTLHEMGKVIYKKRIELLSIFGVLLFLMFLSSFLMFYAEHDAQPKVFENILDTFWWSLVTFTTVGYGDVYPVTAFGKILSAIVVLIGVMLFALPTSILTAEFLNIFQKENKDK